MLVVWALPQLMTQPMITKMYGLPWHIATQCMLHAGSVLQTNKLTLMPEAMTFCMCSAGE